MKSIKIILFIIFLSGALYAQDSVTIRMDPDNVLGGSVSQLFDSVEYIPLQTTKESLFGRIDRLQVADDLFFILDRSSDQVLIFKKDGKYKSKIQMQRYVKSTTQQGISSFMVDEDKKWVIVNNDTKPDVLYFFNYQGNLVKTIVGKQWSNFGYLDQHNYLMAANGDILDSASGLRANCLITDTSTKVIKKSLVKIVPGMMGSGQVVDKVPGEKEVIYAGAFDFSIYKIGITGIENKIKFIFPVIYTPPKEIYGTSYENQIKYTHEVNPKMLMGFLDIHTSGNFLTFSLMHIGFGHPSYIYSASSQNIYSMGNINTDSAHYFLPVISDGGNIYAADRNYFYSHIPVYYFKSGYNDNLKNRKAAYPDKIRRLYTSFGNYDNPIIIRLKPKQGI
ncbi:6-bladed beta-propeller [Chitinophaga oryziterrae]|uniref:6-bladed beta-propeller n=1 Tax=Chitinophaga oryziterrae TaxID=1031224 RepID=A0A6N8J5T7_9BACT|nr:6-bladed beta-propeller [Chitinophaga oryziterrae]MVT39532.1 6-bladed beta-propeller [Chitinophaga oryziterrae]